MMRKRQLPLTNTGFTIVELMIALSILSIILLMATYVLSGIGQLYSKGINTANVQNVTRNVVGDLTAALQFGDQPAATGSQSYSNGSQNVTVRSLCFDTNRYSYILNQELSSSPSYSALDSSGAADPQSYHVLWQDTMLSPASCTPVDITKAAPNEALYGGSTGSGKELIPLRTRLTTFNVSQTTTTSGVYKVTIGLAYGDNDLLTGSGASTVCTGHTGQQYCATSFLNTIASRRL